MPDYVVHCLLLALNKHGRPVSGSRILLLELAYKKNTVDARESPRSGSPSCSAWERKSGPPTRW